MNEHAQNGHGDVARPIVTTWALPLAEHPVLDFYSDFASIALVPVDDGKPRMFAQTQGGDLPMVKVETHDEVTRVRVGMEGQRFAFWRNPGKLHLVICVPENITGSLATGSGRIDAGRLRGCNLSLESGAGAIRAEDVQGSLKLSTKTGRIEVLGLSGALNVSSTAGAILAHLEQLEPGTHRVRTRAGAIEIHLKQGLDVGVDARAHVGHANVEVPARPDAQAQLEVQTHLGSIRVARLGSARRIDAEAESGLAAETSGDDAQELGASPPSVAADEIGRIVSMVVSGRISTHEAEGLLAALGV